jgi:hypothetical protein
MSQFDPAATPMFDSFQAAPDLRPCQALSINVDLEKRNIPHAWGGQLKMHFAREDAVDDLLFNEVVWRSVRGPDRADAGARVRGVRLRTPGREGSRLMIT